MKEEEIKEQLIDRELEKRYNSILKLLRVNILQRAYKKGGKSEDVSLLTSTLTNDLANMDWITITSMEVAELDALSDKIYSCIRCKNPSLHKDVRMCQPRPDAEYDYYCDNCITEIHREWFADIQNEIIPCTECHTSQPRHVLEASEPILNKLPGSYRYVCIECANKLYIDYQRVCGLCRTQFIAYSRGETIEVCKSCRTPKTVKEAQRVEAHKARAREVKVVANLSLSEWLATLDHFNWSCAYCGDKFQALEHYIPLPFGGTTVTNCLPSCTPCNMRKRDKHPEKLIGLFPSDNLARIQTYLQSQKTA